MTMVSVFGAGLPLGSLWFSFQQSNLFSGKLIVLALLGMSIFAWTTMIYKVMDLRSMQRRGRAFLLRYRKERDPLRLFLSRQVAKDSPVTRVYDEACSALSLELESRHGSEGGALDRGLTLTSLQLGAVRNAAERKAAEEYVRLEERMGFLAIAVSASPMMGLLGTVWGVMESFSSMALEGAANLSAVAPGIASALMTTVVGLIVAIPSAIGYNMLATRIKTMVVEMDNFADEFSSELQRLYIRE